VLLLLVFFVAVLKLQVMAAVALTTAETVCLSQANAVLHYRCSLRLLWRLQGISGIDVTDGMCATDVADVLCALGRRYPALHVQLCHSVLRCPSTEAREEHKLGVVATCMDHFAWLLHSPGTVAMDHAACIKLAYRALRSKGNAGCACGPCGP
jgi:hypothetical protein